MLLVAFVFKGTKNAHGKLYKWELRPRRDVLVLGCRGSAYI